jgi:hypothetical protein
MHQPRARDTVAQEAGDAFLSPLVSRRAHLTTGRAGSFIFFHRNVWQRGLRFAPVLYDRTSYVRYRERRVAYVRQNQGCFRGRGYGGYHVREERYMGRSSMGAYKELAGEERQMRGAFSVQCPECGAPPGFACHKAKGKTQYDSHKARRERAYAQALAQALGASY